MNNKFEIFTIGDSENSISVCPGRGGLITSIKLKGKELLFLNEETFFDTSKNVRGGIPVLFLNAGALDKESQKEFSYDLAQHGFARNLSWILDSITDDRFVISLHSDYRTKEMFPYDFCHSIIGEVSNGKAKIIQKTINSGQMPLAVAQGLHPYFFVNASFKDKVSFQSGEDNIIESDFDNRSNSGTLRIDNPGKLSVIIPGIGTLKLDYSSNYCQVWIRSETGKDFICIEPIERGDGGLLNNPRIINPGEVFALENSIELE